ncbi:Chaperone protein ClpB1 [Phytophthora nicotianae]|uniref:NADPH--hemoprotein reductase n=1 Tax=Phytophthora nicotianae TaxID=4792 RepID=A0A0W8DH22_PHYNI|nr:Chaperone protein ClpB1 [Phytophthora nicotianae]
MRLAVLIAALVGAPAVSAGPYDGWAPHRYCNDIDGIEASRVPPLTPEQAERVESLEQVQIIARHGAPQPHEREWDCTTTSVSSQDINPNEHSKGFGRLYRKSYMDGHNILKGDCVIGGLLPLGRHQHKTNGQFLRDAYVGDGPLKLFPTANLSTYHEVEVRQGIFLTYNDSWYAKLAMQPLAHDMLTRLDGVLNDDPDTYKLSVTMAHDSTIMPFLAASVKENWDRLWTPYAGMLVMEVYKTKSGSHAVRMIFHGEPQHIPECHDTLCDIEEFAEAFAFARNPRTQHDCKLPKKKKHKSPSSNLMTTTADGHAGFQASDYIGSYLLLGLVGIAGLLALRAKARRNRLREYCQHQRRFLSDGMDAFMEFEREMALKRRKENPEQFAPSGPLTPPVKPKDDECCHLDCPNCVLLVYQEKLLEYELSLQSQNQRKKPEPPASKYDLSFYSSKDDEELSDTRRKLLIEADRAVFEVAANDVISAPHQTADGAWRSVRHIDLHIREDQQELVSEQASNIGVYVPNDPSVVERMLVHLHVEDPNVVFTAELLPDSPDDGQHQHQGFEHRPFARAGTVHDALTWTFDLDSTPRQSFLRSLAAYASDENDVAALMSPQTAEAIQAERPHQHVTVADIFDRFPSIRLSFAEFFQNAPPTAPRYYTVSSSRQFVPDIVSITLGIRKTDAQPLPRCSSYLAMLKQGDAIRASFYQSSFVFPFHDRRPIMLISAGTGIAPFRAFLQDLEHENDTSPHHHRPAYLFYGCREASVDFLYGEELQRARDSGVLDKLHVEFSGENDQPKRYVQDALRDQSELVARHLLADEGYIYVCGSLDMGRAVKKAIAAALLKHPEYSNGVITTQEDAERVVTQKLAGQLIITELW